MVNLPSKSKGPINNLLTLFEYFIIKLIQMCKCVRTELPKMCQKYVNFIVIHTTAPGSGNEARRIAKEYDQIRNHTLQMNHYELIV